MSYRKLKGLFSEIIPRIGKSTWAAFNIVGFRGSRHYTATACLYVLDFRTWERRPHECEDPILLRSGSVPFLHIPYSNPIIYPKCSSLNPKP